MEEVDRHLPGRVADRQRLQGEHEGRRPEREQRQGDQQPHPVVGFAPEDEGGDRAAHAGEDGVHRGVVDREDVEREADVLQSAQAGRESCPVVHRAVGHG
jgi:hypothetical protein